MPVPTDITAGTISISGSTVTGVGTSFLASDIRQGDLFIWIEGGEGQWLPIVQTVTSNTVLTLAEPWTGPTISGARYRLRYQWDSSRVSAQSRQLIEMLDNGNVLALAGLTGPGVPVFDGPHSMEIRTVESFINGVAYDVQVDTLADRAAYDGQAAGFSVLVSDVGDGRSAIYSKASNTSGNWSDPAYVTGPVGPTVTISGGNTTTLSPGSQATFEVRSVAGGYELDAGIPSGRGVNPKGAYSASAGYVTDDAVLFDGSTWLAIGPTTGNSPPTLPITQNTYWRLLAQKGANGDGSVTAGTGVSVDNTDPSNFTVSTANVEIASDLPTANVPNNFAYVRTSANNTTGKLGASLYKKVGAQPSHNLFEPALGGGFWDIAEPRVDAAMAGMIGDGSYDNGSALSDLFGYAAEFGAEVYLPTGTYNTSGTVNITAPEKPPSMVGDGAHSSILRPTAGDKTILRFDQCSGLHLQGFRVEKRGTAEDTLGTGIELSQTSYFYLKDICVWGHSVGLRLVNSLSGIIERPLLIWNQYGVYADIDGSLPFQSRPNALTFMSPTIGLNARRGMWFREPGTLNIIGGSVEGNGYGHTSDHGGIYILNAGTEGAAVNITGVQMERNRGEADIHIANLINPNTIFNIRDNTIFPIDSTDFTTNRIYFENGVQQHANITGNGFKHYGSYVPNTSRKYIKAANPTLLTVNVGGDIKQFTTAQEFPTGLGAMGMSYGARVAADGTMTRGSSGWTSVNSQPGVYRITVPSYINVNDFAWSGLAVTSPPARAIQRIVLTSATEVDVVMVDTTVSPVVPANSAFNIVATGIS